MLLHQKGAGNGGAIAWLGLWFALLAAAGFAWAEGPATAVLPERCTAACVEPFGMQLGTASGGVAAYSNCSARCFVPVPNRVDGTYTGIRWQCVEYARRWLLERRGVVFGDVDVAADLWLKVDSVTRVGDGRVLPLAAQLNGAPEPPRVGDLLIYGREYLNTGHVAVVVAVDAAAGTVAVAEQNYRNARWADGYARQIAWVRHGAEYWLLDPYLIGWKRVVDD